MIKIIAVIGGFIRFPFTTNEPSEIKLRQNFWRDFLIDIKLSLPDLVDVSPSIIKEQWENFAKNFTFMEMHALGEIIQLNTLCPQREIKEDLDF